MTSSRYDRILNILRKEALDDPETGWISDIARRRPQYDEAGQTITFDGGSIDLGHLAAIIDDCIVDDM